MAPEVGLAGGMGAILALLDPAALRQFAAQ
jgi:hypothetical protein